MNVHRVAVPGAPGVVLAVDERPPPRAALGPPCVFLPGFGSMRRGQKAVVLGCALAAAGRRFLALDYEGHGDSTGDFGTLTVSRHLRDLEAVRAALLGDERHVLVGSSLGGLVATLAAARAPERVAALVLIAPAFGFRARWERRVGPAALAEWERTGRHAHRGEFVSAELDFALLADARALDEEAAARAVRAPILLVHGDADEIVPIACSERFAALATAPLRFVRLPGGSHRLERHLDALVAAVTDFVAAAAR